MCACVHADPGPVQRMSRRSSNFDEPVAGAHQIAAAVLDRADHVAELLVGDARHEREPQLARRQQPRQALGVTLVGLDPVTRRARDLPRGHDPHVDPALDRAARASPNPVGPAS